MAIVTPADRPKSVRNRCVIEVFGGVLCVVTLLFGFFCRCKGFCHRAESDLFLFSYLKKDDENTHVPVGCWIYYLKFSYASRDSFPVLYFALQANGHP